jgi:hypothetical protein
MTHMAKTTQNWDYLIARREREFYKEYRKRHTPPALVKSK